MTSTTIPLDSITVASPCVADWNQMRGDDRVRFCGQCQLHVYNLSDMSRREAEMLVNTQEGRLCARFFRRADGTVLTRDCPVGVRAVRRRLARALAGVATLLGFLAFGTLFARGSSSHPTTGNPTGPLGKLIEWIDGPPQSHSMPPQSHSMMMGAVPPVSRPARQPAATNSPAGPAKP